MKKQILFMTFLSLALMFAGVNKVYGQGPNTTDPDYLEGAADCLIPVPLNCTTTSGELNPIPGHEYTYTVDDAGITDGTSVASIHWFVYDNAGGAPITDGALISTETDSGEDDYNQNVDPGDGFGKFIANVVAGTYNKRSTTLPDDFSISLTWKYFDPSNVVLLVAYIEGADGCSDNIEAYRIKPAFSFTLDVASLTPSGKFRDNDPTLSAHECVSPVWSASYDPTEGTGDNGELNMDYGANYVFFTVSAANFDHSWQPTFAATHSGSSTISEIVWAFPDDAVDENFTEWNAQNAVVNAPDNGTVGEDGQCIVVRVLVEHGTVENADPSTVTLTVNGIMYDASVTTGDAYATADLADLDDVDIEGDTVCQHVDDADQAVYILTPRPKIEADTPTPFVDKP